MDLLTCVNFVAWPMLALGYPIFVSIRTIESGSKYDKRKIATYWIIFSLIYLFEHVFHKFLGWVPLWSYIRLIFICWLVIPQLNGAFYVYQNLVHPYLQSKLPYSVTQFYATCSEWFIILKKDSSIKKETFLAVAESYVEENGSGTLETLIAGKSECNEGGQVFGEIQVMECTAKRDAAVSNQIENKTSSAIQVTNKPVIPAVSKLPDSSSSSSYLPVLQTSWTCEICEVTVSSELTLQSHIRGKKHWAQSRLWCDICHLRVSGEIDMIAHLKGKRHLAKLQETFANAEAA